VNWRVAVLERLADLLEGDIWSNVAAYLFPVKP
jgi:hypothetical protein